MRREYYRQAFHLLNYHDEEDGELASKIGKIAYDSLKTDIAKEWLRKAAELKNYKGAYYLGKIFEDSYKNISGNKIALIESAYLYKETVRLVSSEEPEEIEAVKPQEFIDRLNISV